MKRILMLTLLTVTLGISASAQIITNGSFEPWSCYSSIIAWEDDIPGWVIAGTSVYWHCGGYPIPAHENASVELWDHHGTPSSIFQDVPTIPGVVYQVTFEMSGWNIGEPAKTMTVTADAASPANYEYIDTGNTLYNMNWAPKTYSFTAADASTRLRFTSTTSGVGGPFIDNVFAYERAGMVCHTNNGSGAPRTLNLTEGWAFWAHTQHGDQIGACP